jgi:hypothetical protein
MTLIAHVPESALGVDRLDHPLAAHVVLAGRIAWGLAVSSSCGCHPGMDDCAFAGIASFAGVTSLSRVGSFKEN